MESVDGPAPWLPLGIVGLMTILVATDELLLLDDELRAVRTITVSPVEISLRLAVEPPSVTVVLLVILKVLDSELIWSSTVTLSLEMAVTVPMAPPIMPMRPPGPPCPLLLPLPNEPIWPLPGRFADELLLWPMA